MKKHLIFVLLLLSFNMVYSQDTLEYQEMEIIHSEYGKDWAAGLNILGNGLIGLHYKKILKNQSQIEIGPSFTATINYNELSNGDYEIDSFDPAVSIGAGYNFFIKSSFVRRKEKLKKNYISPKIAYDIGVGNSVYGIISWHRERFFAENPNKSFGFDLGLLYQKTLGDYGILRGDEFVDNRIGLFIRLEWNWYSKKGDSNR